MTQMDAATIQVVAARGLIINSEDKIIVVSTDSKKWHIPGGWVEHMEPLKDGCEREIMEELGLSIKASNVLHICEIIENKKTSFGNYIQKFDIYILCSIVGDDRLKDQWIDRDNGDIKHRKYIDNDDWQNNPSILAPQFLRNIPLQKLKNLPNCFTSIIF